MLLTHEKFRGFAPNAVADARESTEVLVCLSSCESRAEVDDCVDQAVAAGGTTFPRSGGPRPRVRSTASRTLDAAVRGWCGWT